MYFCIHFIHENMKKQLKVAEIFGTALMAKDGKVQDSFEPL